MCIRDRAPLALLFDDPAVTATLYSDNPSIDCLNRSAALVAQALAGRTDGLSVLEIGAGTAATTRHLVPALDGRLRHYRFTDVSPLFLDEARQRFAGHAALDYALFDINVPLDFDAHPANGYDLVVAANVLHDARDAVRSLRRIGQLLKPGGHLLMIEATERDSMLQMASIGFIEGLNGYDDFRTADEQPMLDLPAWRDALAEAGFAVERAWPDTQCSPLRQHLVLAQATQTGRLDTAALESDLRLRMGDALPRVRIRQAESIERYAKRATASARHDAVQAASAALAKPLTVTAPDDRDPACAAALERTVGEVWETLLKCPIGSDSDFFQSGGDSLIATRMVAQLNGGGMRGASLQALFAAPTLAAFCATLDAPDASTAGADSAGGNDHAAISVIPLAHGPDPHEVFVFHASDGELAAYLPLARHLGCRVHGLRAPDTRLPQSLDALAAHYAQAVRAAQPGGPYTLLGWSYGAFTAAAAAHILHAAGETVELVLIDPVCRDDFRATEPASRLRLLAQDSNAPALPEDFDALAPDRQAACFAEAAQTAGLLPAHTSADEGLRWLERVLGLLDLLAHHHAPPKLPVRCLWLAAARRPARWQPAERDWHAWEAYAERHTLDADHWSLVLDDTHAQRIAALLRQWRGRTNLPQEQVA